MYFDQNTAQQAGRALDWFAIDNLFSAHCLCRKARKRRYELDTYWSARKDIAYSEGTACYNGRKSVYRVYAGLEEEMDAGKLALLHERFPEQVPADDSALGIGDLDLLYSGSAYIEIAKDGGTAKGVWYTVGLSAEPDENGVPRGGLYTGRAAVEFIKEDGQWKIWHYRTSPDFSWLIPQEQLLAGTGPCADVHPDPEHPAPNLKLKPLAGGEQWSAFKVPAAAPQTVAPYETWTPEDSFVAPAEAADWTWDTDAGAAPDLSHAEEDARYAANHIEVLNLSAIHCYGYGSQQMVMELDRFWAQRTENLAGCHADRAHQGHDLQYKYYARGNMGMNWGKVELMLKLFPDRVALHPYNLGIGELVIRFYTSPYIMVADDCKTAQGVWYSFGISSEVDKQAHPVPFMQWGREMCDFVLEGDTWRFLHFRLSADIDYLLDYRVVMGEGLENGFPRTVKVEKPAPDSRLRPFLMDEPYSPFRVANYSPEPPFPFLTWDNRASWVLPEVTD